MNREVCVYKKLKYVLSVPDKYLEGKKYPLLIFLHGAGTRGSNIDILLSSQFFTQTGGNLAEFIVAAPLCNADSWFEIAEQLHDFCAHIIKRPDVDNTRCCLIGSSMGGYAVWQEAMSHPELYAAAVPICGGGMYWNAERLKNVKIRAFHGSEDNIVFPEESKKMVEAIKRCGGDAELTVYEGVGHNSWINVYKDNDVFKWILEQKNADTKVNKSLTEDAEMFG